jgi:hypothetical protein
MEIKVTSCADCPLSEVEFTERELLLELQRSKTRYFTKEEFDRLKYLSTKMFENAGSPHEPSQTTVYNR